MQGFSIIFQSPVTLAATGIWIPFGSLIPVIPAAAGIQSPDYVPRQLCQLKNYLKSPGQ